MQLGRDLFNGNIRAMMVNVPILGEAKLYGYRYDQLNRIKAMNSFNGFDSTLNKFGASNIPAISTDYKERITYDPNGNIRSYLRNGTTQGGTPLGMDSLTYGYNTDTYGHLLNNKLRQVHDAVGDGNYTEDIDNQADDNYKYDAIGNLVQDKAQGIYDPAYPTKNMIGWTVYGKIAWIRKIKAGVTTGITYNYDPSGNRISKAVTIVSTTTTTYYVRDASGNTMSVYAKDAAINNGALTQTEISEYGSSRLGVWNINRSVAAIGSMNFSVFRNNFIRGNKSFELTNHLGNVLATISDKKMQHNTSGTVVDWYNAEVVTAQDYFVFGMGMPGRGYQNGSGTYRYSINGQEKSQDINANLTTAKFWEYDSRIGRRWNVDPIPNNGFSAYSAFNCNPIFNTDYNGDKVSPPSEFDKDGNKIGDLGGDKVDFFHQKDGGVKIIERETGAKQKGTISANVEGTAYNTGESYTYKGKDYNIQRTTPGTGQVTFNIPFDNGKIVKLSFTIDMGGGGAGLTPDGQYKSTGFKSGWEGNFNHAKEGGAYTAEDGFGFKLPMLPIDNPNNKRTQILYHPHSQIGSEGCSAIQYTSEAHMIHSMFTTIFKVQHSFISTVKIAGNGNIMFNVSDPKLHAQHKGRWSSPPEKFKKDF